MRNKIIPYNPKLKQIARMLRKNSTLSEILLWQEIRNKVMMGYQFHRQVPINEFIADFYCHELKLVIEIDGDSHDFKYTKDRKRQEKLESLGVRFLRFEDLVVKQSMGYVLDEIYYWINDYESGKTSL